MQIQMIFILFFPAYISLFLAVFHNAIITHSNCMQYHFIHLPVENHVCAIEWPKQNSQTTQYNRIASSSPIGHVIVFQFMHLSCSITANFYPIGVVKKKKRSKKQSPQKERETHIRHLHSSRIQSNTMPKIKEKK